MASALALALVAMTVSLVMPKTYTANASLLMFVRQTGSQLGTNQPLLSVETIDGSARRQGLLALARSEAIEAQLPDDVLQRAAPVKYRRGMLIQGKKITVTAEGDLLKVKAIAATPEQAQELANVWTDTFVSEVTRLYSDQHSSVERTGAALLPLAPSEPSIVRNTVAGGVAGVLLSVLVVLGMTLTGASLTLPYRRKNQERAATQPSPTR